MRDNAILADRLDEAFEPLEIDHQTIANKVGASMNEELVREEEASLIQDVRTTDAGKAADDSWLNDGLRSSKKKKDKRMSWSDD